VRLLELDCCGDVGSGGERRLCGVGGRDALLIGFDGNGLTRPRVPGGGDAAPSESGEIAPSLCVNVSELEEGRCVEGRLLVRTGETGNPYVEYTSTG